MDLTSHYFDAINLMANLSFQYLTLQKEVAILQLLVRKNRLNPEMYYMDNFLDEDSISVLQETAGQLVSIESMFEEATLEEIQEYISSVEGLSDKADQAIQTARQNISLLKKGNE